METGSSERRDGIKVPASAEEFCWRTEGWNLDGPRTQFVVNSIFKARWPRAGSLEKLRDRRFRGGPIVPIEDASALPRDEHGEAFEDHERMCRRRDAATRPRAETRARGELSARGSSKIETTPHAGAPAAAAAAAARARRRRADRRRTSSRNAAAGGGSAASVAPCPRTATFSRVSVRIVATASSSGLEKGA